MKIINAKYEFINEPNVTKKIERIARICYKSEDKIGEDTDLKMVNSLITRQHTAMLEHASIALVVNHSDYYFIKQVIETMTTQCHDNSKTKNCYLRTTYHSTHDSFGIENTGQRYVVSGNLRAWYDYFKFAIEYPYGIQEPLFNTVNNAANHIFDCFADKIGVQKGFEHCFKRPSDVRLITDYTKLSDAERMVHETISILFTVDRGVTHELVRHRDCSFAQESTRYCNYSNGKFGQEITVIEPCFWSIDNSTPDNIGCYNAWYDSCKFSEAQYFKILNNGGTPQQARDVLPTSVKAEIVMTTNLREWKHIFNLRAYDSTGPAHLQIKEVMVPCVKELIDNNYAFAFKADK